MENLSPFRLLGENHILGRLNLAAVADLTLIPHSSLPVSRCRGCVNISWLVLALAAENTDNVCSFSFHVVE